MAILIVFAKWFGFLAVVFAFLFALFRMQKK